MQNSLGYPQHASVVHMLIDAAHISPNSEALVCGKDRLSYADYLRAVSGFAHTLVDHDLRGQRVAMLMRNSVDFCIAMFAVQMAGAQVVPLNPRYTKTNCLLCSRTQTSLPLYTTRRILPAIVKSFVS